MLSKVAAMQSGPGPLNIQALLQALIVHLLRGGFVVRICCCGNGSNTRRRGRFRSGAGGTRPVARSISRVESVEL